MSAIEFTCEDCKRDIISLGHHDGIEVCYVCRFIRGCPEMPDEVKDQLRGIVLTPPNRRLQ